MALLAVTCLIGATACGGSHFANLPGAPLAVNLSVYINDQQVSVSPTSLGAGPVNLVITNQASRTEALRVTDASARQLATTGPITPQATAQLTVDFHSPGDYFISVATGQPNQAQQAFPTPPAPSAALRIGRPRRSASDALLKP